jgi:hypothetical protein
MNNSYILLRNNKESKSLNLDALQQIGLKPTDQIWVECQSVCWQYPHEIAELKGLVGENNSPFVEQAKTQPIESTTDYNEITLKKKAEKKLVYGELSAIVNSNKKQYNDADPFSDSHLSEMHKYGGLSSSEEIIVEKKPEDIDIKYSLPLLDKVKEMYVNNPENQVPVQKRGIQVKLPKQFKKIVVYTGLVVAGALLMLLINNISGKKTPAVSQETVQQNTDKNTVATLPSSPILTVTEEPVDIQKEELPTDEILLPKDEKETNTLPLKKVTVEKKESENLVTKETVKGEVENINQEAKANTEPKIVSIESISSKLSLNANDFVVGSFGGIKNLELTLHNNSKYLVDKVSAELQYLNPEGTVLKTENIYFQSVSPGQKETVAVKKSKRGVKINYRIINIESKVLNNGTAGL